MATDVLEGLQERLGDPKRALEDQRRLNRDIKYLLSHLPKWRKEHPNRWVAVYDGKLVAVEGSRDRLLKAIDQQKLPLRKVLIDFVREEETAFIL